jgi:metallo-beta-lactamase family protein
MIWLPGLRPKGVQGIDYSMQKTNKPSPELIRLSGLSVEQLFELQQALSLFPFIESASFFGSRGRGTFHQGSDVDVALVGEHLELSDVALVREWLNENTRLPFQFDVVLQNEDATDRFREQIQGDLLPFYQWQPGIRHHGALHGVTGSCHELFYRRKQGQARSLLVDCGLFQGDDHSSYGAISANANKLFIDFDLAAVQALCLTHAHIDHIGRLPYLVMAGFDQPIYCTPATARLTPLMLEDAIKLGVTRDKRLIGRLLARISELLIPVEYDAWQVVDENLKIRFRQAGHILGSAFVEVDMPRPPLTLPSGRQSRRHRVIFSGDLGAPYAPLLPSPKSPYRCDTLVLESTYGDRLHDGRRLRARQLKRIVERALANRGAVLIPAFSLGRTQELLYEFEQIIHRFGASWQDIEVVVDSPMAQRITGIYRELSALWDKEARRKKSASRHPLNFEQMTVIDDHQTHQQVVAYLQKTARPTLVIAASGMCTGGRIVEYLKALIEDERTDILFTGYQAQGSTGRAIQRYGDKSVYPDGYVDIDGQRYRIRAAVHTISGYSAHADAKDLLKFITRMRRPPVDIRLVHGDEPAKRALKGKIADALPGVRVVIP